MAIDKTDQIVEIFVTGSLSFPEVVTSAMQGKPITITLDGATLAGFSALVGSQRVTSATARPSQRQGKDHVRIQIEAASVTIAEDTTAPGGGGGGGGG